MCNKLAIAVFACAALFVSISFAQDAAQWKVGDKVEILNLSKEWVPGTVIGTVDWNGKTLYRVELDDKNAPNVYFNHTPPSDMRPRGGNPAPVPGNDNGGNGSGTQPAAGQFAEGDMVDTLYDPRHGHNRGTIIAVGDRKYKVHYTGCEDAFDEWVDSSLVRPPSTISSTAPEITYLFGRWRTTTVAVGVIMPCGATRRAFRSTPTEHTHGRSTRASPPPPDAGRPMPKSPCSTRERKNLTASSSKTPRATPGKRSGGLSKARPKTISRSTACAQVKAK
jgi:hypothetical protein